MSSISFIFISFYLFIYFQFFLAIIWHFLHQLGINQVLNGTITSFSNAGQLSCLISSTKGILFCCKKNECCSHKFLVVLIKISWLKLCSNSWSNNKNYLHGVHKIRWISSKLGKILPLHSSTLFLCFYIIRH